MTETRPTYTKRPGKGNKESFFEENRRISEQNRRDYADWMSKNTGAGRLTNKNKEVV